MKYKYMQQAFNWFAFNWNKPLTKPKPESIRITYWQEV